jgi:predicted permease
MGACALGVLVGYAAIRALLAVNTGNLHLIGPGGSGVHIDWRVMGFAVAVSIVTGVTFGLAPALQASRVDLNSILKDVSGRFGTGFRRNKLRPALVISEASLAVILLVASALLIRSFVALYRVDRGLETRNVVTLRTSWSDPKDLRAIGQADTIRRGLEQIRSLAGVAAASATCCVPLQDEYGLPFEILGLFSPKSLDVGGAWSAVSPGFFEVFRIPVKRGRTFTERDAGKGPPVVVINERMAKEYWKDRDPLGDRIVIGRGMTTSAFKDEPPRQIIGIVGDVRNAGLNKDQTADLMMYVPQAQLTNAESSWVAVNGQIVWVVRTKRAFHGLLPAIREQLRYATNLPVSDVLSMQEVLSLSTSRQQFNMLVMTVFGCVALLLATIGIYGLMAYTVEQRKQEIGIRLALGAGPGQVRNMVVREGMTLAVAGVVIGTGAAWGLSRFIESLLFEVKARDPMVFFAVPMILALAAVIAVWLPARHASMVNPIASLRYE